MSNSPDVSPLYSPDPRPDDVVFSARPSPGFALDNPPSPRSPQHYLRSSSTLSSPRSTNADEAASHAQQPGPPRSKPIAIELPAPKKVTSAPVYTPTAPLSARGDLPGGYFPLHEDQSRVYRSHPFQLDATKARLRSIQRASKDSPPDTKGPGCAVVAKGDIGPATTNLPPAKADRTMEIPAFNVNSFARAESPSSSSTTPVASYMPLGDQSSPLPMGKYYPSNYERRKDEKRGKNRRPTTSGSSLSSSTKSESQLPTVNQPAATGHVRNESDAKRRLQQYQRDMIAQATIALNRGNTKEALGSIRSFGFNNMMKPSKPRLAPLGSPGPVTPMELEGTEQGYLDVHGGGGGGGGRAPAELVQSPEEERMRKEGRGSPAADFGRSTL
ncbi:hypothetical protein F4802DRAFT_598954 [Xylaria palmicola]|nr:hypothetical protein F4802DRAFT_598954 [Xylaria palmicola]